MRNLAYFAFLFALLLATISCKKKDIDLDTLNTNAFDSDYAGAPLFTVVDSYTTSYVANGILVTALHVEVQVHTEYFERSNTVFQAKYTGASTGLVPSNDMPDRTFTMIKNNVQSGAAYCWNLNVQNGGVNGGGNELCVTAP